MINHGWTQMNTDKKYLIEFSYLCSSVSICGSKLFSVFSVSPW